MTTLLVLFACSLISIYVEFFLPGALFGILGAMLAMATIGYSFTLFSLPLALLYSVGVLGTIYLVVQLTLRQIENKYATNSMMHSEDQSGYKASSFHEELIGKEAVAHTDLRPLGIITIQGQEHQASAQYGFIQAGTPVTIIGGQGTTLIVRISSSESTSSNQGSS